LPRMRAGPARLGDAPQRVPPHDHPLCRAGHRLRRWRVLVGNVQQQERPHSRRDQERRYRLSRPANSIAKNTHARNITTSVISQHIAAPPYDLCGRRRAAEPVVLPHRWPGSRLPLVGPFWSRRVGPSPALAVKVHTHHTLEAAYPNPVLLAVKLHREMRTLHRSVECGKHSGLQVVPRLHFRRLLVRQELQLLQHVPSPFVGMESCWRARFTSFTTCSARRDGHNVLPSSSLTTVCPFFVGCTETT